MRYLTLIVLMVLLLGCVEPDPMRAAIANERTIQANNSQAAQAAQIERAQQSDVDARNAQALLQALQAQQAIVAAQAASAQAESQTAIVASNNQALVLVADRIAAASKPDYTPLYVGIGALTMIALAWILVRGRKPVIQPIAVPRLLPSPAGTEVWLHPDGSIQWIRLSDCKVKMLQPGDQMYRRLLTSN